MAKEPNQEPAVTSEEQPVLPKWVCRVEGTPKDSQWTVGELFHLECEGPTVEFNSTHLQTKPPEGAEFSLRILKVEKQDANSGSFLATSYMAGSHNFKDLVIVEAGQAKFRMEPIQINVKTVLENPKQKPFGPILAMKLQYPVWLWFALGLSVLAIVFYSLFRFRRNVQMKRVIDELKEHNTALGAYNQFNKDLRTLGRKNIFGKIEAWDQEKKTRYVENLDEIFRMYLLREFYVPALDWHSKLVLKKISKDDKKHFSNYSTHLRTFLKELDRAKTDASKVNVHDCQQLTQMARKTTQVIWKQRKT